MSFQAPPPSTLAGKKRNTNAQGSSQASSSQQQHHQRVPGLESVQLSVSELSIDTRFKSSQSSQQGGGAEGVPLRQRSASEESGEFDTSAFTRVVAGQGRGDLVTVDARVVHSSKARDEFVIEVTLEIVSGPRRGDRVLWTVSRNKADVNRFYERTRHTGTGNLFPYPPWGRPSLAKASSFLRSSRQPKKRTQPAAAAASASAAASLAAPAASSSSSARASPPPLPSRNLVSTLTSVFATHPPSTSSSTPPATSTSNFTRRLKSENMQDFLDKCLQYWQRKWRSPSVDENGLAQEFDHFLCKSNDYGLAFTKSASIDAPISFRAAMDAIAYGGPATGGAGTDLAARALSLQSLDVSRSVTTTESKVFLTLLLANPTHGDMGTVRKHVFMYAWARYMKSHQFLESESSPSSSVPSSPLLSPSVVSSPVEEFWFASTKADGNLMWRREATRQGALKTRFVSRLPDVFSTPPTPASTQHYNEVWTCFTDTVLKRAEMLLQWKLKIAAESAEAEQRPAPASLGGMSRVFTGFLLGGGRRAAAGAAEGNQR